MSFLNSITSSLRRFGQSFRGDSVSDSERVRILSSSDATCETSPYAKEQQTDNKERATFDDAPERSRTESFRRKITAGDCEPYQMDSSFYNMGFSMSPHDLERSWKRNRPSLKSNSSDIQRKRSKSECKISIHRYPVDNTYIDKKCGPPIPPDPSYKKVSRYLQSHCSCSLTCFLSFITSFIPVLSWLPNYKLVYLLPDLIAGFTIAILHIPQGMAYGVLAGVNAENGLYVSFFPVLIYFLFGTSRHISIGTFAVASLMLNSAVHGAGGVVARSLNVTNPNISSLTNVTVSELTAWPPTNLEIVTTLAISVGFLQIFMGVFQLGALTVVLSDQLVSGFSTGAACHVAVSQIKDLFGIHIGTYGGTLKLIYMVRDIFINLVHTNKATVVASAISIFVLAFFKEQVDERLRGKLKMPIPIDLIVVVLGTAISYFADLHENYGVKVILEIPTGLPEPLPPRLDLMLSLIGDSFAIAVVTYVISLSMAKILSAKNKYQIRPNQELLALGFANVFSSFFACYPCSASLSRSVVQERSGGKTQVASIVSCCILLVVLLALAPLFFSLPKCILSCIILVALKPMFLQVKDLCKAWSISKMDALIWFVAFTSTVLLDVTYGLLAGVIFSLLTVIIRTVIPTRALLGKIPETDIYLDSKRYNLAPEIEGMKIFHFESALYFINKEIFKNSLYKHVPPTNSDPSTKSASERIHRIIIDCSTFTYVDISGLNTLLELMKEYQELGISVFLSGCSISMLSVMEKAKFMENVPHHPCIFPTVHDAVQFKFLAHAVSES